MIQMVKWEGALKDINAKGIWLSLRAQRGLLWEGMFKQGSEDWVGNSILERAFQVVGICVKDVRKEILKGRTKAGRMQLQE